MSKKSEEIQSRIVKVQTAGNMVISLRMNETISETLANELLNKIDECVENLKSRIK